MLEEKRNLSQNNSNAAEKPKVKGFFKRLQYVLALILVVCVCVIFWFVGGEDFVHNLSVFKSQTRALHSKNISLVEHEDQVIKEEQEEISQLQAKILQLEGIQSQMAHSLQVLQDKQDASQNTLSPEDIRAVLWQTLNARVKAGLSFSHILKVLAYNEKDEAVLKPLKDLSAYSAGIKTSRALEDALSGLKPENDVIISDGFLRKILNLLKGSIKIEKREDVAVKQLVDAISANDLARASRIVSEGQVSLYVKQSPAWKNVQDFLAVHTLLDQVEKALDKNVDE